MPKTLQAMFYPKNVPNIERLIRIIVGIALIALSLSAQATFGAIGVLVAIASAVTLILTGFVGWCPMCALVGRKIKKNNG